MGSFLTLIELLDGFQQMCLIGRTEERIDLLHIKGKLMITNDNLHIHVDCGRTGESNG